VEFSTFGFVGKLAVATAPNFKAGTQVNVEVVAPVIPPDPLQIELRPTPNIALFNPANGLWHAGGQPILVTLPNNNDRTPFMMRGSPGTYKVEFHSPGCQFGMIGGTVSS
jgi:hypothetical protein